MSSIKLADICKAFPLEPWSGPVGSRKLSFPDYMTTAQDGGKVVSLWGSVDPRAIVRSEVLGQWKIPMKPSGTEPATFRFVAQHLNHCATAGEYRYLSKIQIKIRNPTRVEENAC